MYNLLHNLNLAYVCLINNYVITLVKISPASNILSSLKFLRNLHDSTNHRDLLILDLVSSPAKVITLIIAPHLK